MSVPLWEIETSWFLPSQREVSENTFTYKDWKDFLLCRPYAYWKPYILTSWSWKKVSHIPVSRHRQIYEILSDSEKELFKLQLVFMTPSRFQDVSRAEMFISETDEPAVRTWLKKHMPKFWKIE